MTVLPADPHIEEAVIGYLLVPQNDTTNVLDVITGDDFSSPLWRAVHRSVVDEPALDVRSRVEHIRRRDPGLEVTDLTLMAALSAGCMNSTVDGAIRRLIGLTTRRSAMWAADSITQAAADPTVDEAAIVELAQQAVADLHVPLANAEPSIDVGTFLDTHDDAYDWVIPGLLEAGDRMVVTAVEGGGKSTMLRQLAVCAAAGIHPFTFEKVRPVNVLLVDLENGERHVRRKLRPLVQACAQHLDPARLRLEVKPGGIDIAKRGGQSWLAERVHANRAELVVAGPIYRLTAGVAAKGDIGGEDAARTVVTALDKIRSKFGVALVLESHAPHAVGGNQRDLRPFGSSVWLRWPEFGVGLRRDPDDANRALLVHWRQPRDDRRWPVALTRRGLWPWTAEYDRETP